MAEPEVKGPKSTFTPQCFCPRCNAKIDMATSSEDHVPIPGSISICVYCIGVNVFAEDLTLRPLGPQDLATLIEEDEDIAKAIKVATIVNQKLKKKGG